MNFLCHCPDHINRLLERQEKLYERQTELKTLLEACEGSGDPVADGASATVENWSGPFEWDSKADDVRFNVFGIPTYRENQREVGAVLGRFFFLLFNLCTAASIV